jgi:hypothetical protein
MIRQVMSFFKAINDWGDYTQQRFVTSLQQLDTWRQFFLVLAVFGIPWLFAWNSHIIQPWSESFFRYGPYDPVTPGTILLRRIWSTVVCAPVIIYAVIRFSVNRYRMHQESKKKDQTEPSN